MKSILITTLVALSAAAFTGSPALAEPLSTRTALAVNTGGLDLSTEKGVRTLDLRILHAASALCGTPSPADARGRIKLEECRTEARAAASVARERILAAARTPVELASAK